MTFELVQKIVATIIRTVENSAVMSVRALKAHTFSVRVSNQPSTQSIKGTVTVGNQKNIEKLLAKLTVAVAKLPTVYPETKIPSPLPYPKEISVSNLESVPQADLKRVEELLMKLVREMKALPKEYPKQEKFPTIPAFPKFPEFPKQLPFPTSMKVNVPTEIRVNNLKELFEDLTGKDPKKHLNVRLSDGKEFYKAVQEIMTAGRSKLPFVNTQGQDIPAHVDHQQRIVLSPDYLIVDEETISGTTYTGNERFDGRWFLMRIQTSPTRIRYASFGNNDQYTSYKNAWDNKVILVFDYPSKVNI